MTEKGNQWEDLRKRARQLENEIDLKLVSFSKLGTSFSNRDSYNPSSPTTPLINKSSSEHMIETMAMEIEQLLANLTEVNDRLSDHATTHTSSTALHTLQRHRDILLDYSHEYNKTKANILACQQREDLLGSVRRDIDAYKSGMNRRTDMLLKEHEHIRNSERLVDEQIGIAMSTKENMAAQKGVLHAITGRMTTVANQFPVINNLVQKINLRKRRDSLILGAVIAICIILLMMYAFS